jgi:hypothetical protein
MDTLGLLGDGDELQLIYDIERVFDITFTKAELEDSRTVGDIENAVWHHLLAKAPEQNRCATASAFYELRRVLGSGGQCRKFAPAMPLATLDLSPAAISALVSNATGLTLRFPATKISSGGLWMILIGILPGMIAATNLSSMPLLVGAIGFILLGSLAIRFDTGSFGEAQTLGDAARELVNQNFGVFISRGARFSRASAWQVLRAVLADVADRRVEGIELNMRLIGRESAA